MDAEGHQAGLADADANSESDANTHGYSGANTYAYADCNSDTDRSDGLGQPGTTGA